MSPRELLILILGLAIIVVVMRGMYVALRARKGQIRLAIDKNIPRDVDLNALEMAELPGGGARVVARSFDEVNRQNNAVEVATANAVAYDLGQQSRKDEAIPILMDPVQLRSSNVDAVTADLDPEFDHETYESESIENEKFGKNTSAQSTSNNLNPDNSAFEQNAVRAQNSADDFEEDEYEEEATADADSILFDYDAGSKRVDNLAQVTPDYPDDDDDDDDEDFDDDYVDEDDEDDNAEVGEEDLDLDDEDLDTDDSDVSDEDEEFDDDELEEDLDDDEDFTEEDGDDDYDPLDEEDLNEEDLDDPELGFAKEDMDEFSMTAGERIGYTDTPRQAGLFGDNEQVAPKSVSPKAKRKSLFAALTRKTAEKQDARPVTSKPVATKPRAPVQDANFAAKTHTQAPAPVSIQRQNSPTQNPKRATAPVQPELKSAEVTPVQRIKPARENIRVQEEVPESASEKIATEPSEVIVLNVMAKPGRVFAGDDLLHILITSGMKFGDMNIFHRRLGGDAKGPVIFSIANILNPGTFDLNKMHEFTTLGVSLFLALPTPINNLEAFNQMLSVAQQIGASVDGELRDDHRNLMTAQTIEHYRQRVRDFELRRLKAVGTRG